MGTESSRSAKETKHNPSTSEGRMSERIVACVNACEGLNPEAVPDLLAAAEAMNRALSPYVEAVLRVPRSFTPIEREIYDALGPFRAAIARAQGE